MRNVIFAINMSMDGCVDHAKMTGDDEIHEYFARLLRDVDLLVFGRKTYELMVPFWPDVAKNQSAETRAMNEFAQAFDSVARIIVFSQTLRGAEGTKTRVVRTKPEDEIRTLKQEQGGNILLGGVDIPSQLVESDLIDEYRIVVQPMITGRGRRLFDGVDLQKARHLRLVESTALKSGCIALRYLKQ